MLRRTAFVLLPLLVIGTCWLLVPTGARLAEPRTHVPLDALGKRPFPIVVMRGNVPAVMLLDDPRHVPAGASVLIPPGAEQRFHDRNWVLHVDRIRADRQRIELYWMEDGYDGGVYEATPTTIRPLYRKFTGPGFALIAAQRAFLLAAAIWILPAALTLWLTRRRT
jgi:hypothetical protein